MGSFMIKEITVILYEISYSYLRSTCCNYSNCVGNFSTFDHLCRKLAAPFHTVVQKDFKKNDKKCEMCKLCMCRNYYVSRYTSATYFLRNTSHIHGLLFLLSFLDIFSC